MKLDASVQQFLQQMAQREGQAAAQLQQLTGQEAQNQQMLQHAIQTAGQAISQPLVPTQPLTATQPLAPAQSMAPVQRAQELIGGVSVPKVSIPNIMEQYQQYQQ